MMPDDIDEQSGKPVSELLHSKQPAARTPAYLSAFDNCPELVDLDITEETLSKTARTLEGAAGAGAAEVWNLHPTPPECNCTIGNMVVK